jgi:hypothetical protein
MRDLIVAPALQAGAMRAEEKRRIRIDAGHPVSRPLEGAPLRLARGDLHEIERLVSPATVARAS